MNTRIYAVTNKDGTVRLIEAPNHAQALRWVAQQTLTVQMPSQRELVDLLTKGTKVEKIGTEDAPDQG